MNEDENGQMKEFGDVTVLRDSPTLVAALKTAAGRPMSTSERQAQAVSWIAGQTGLDRQAIAATLKRAEGEHVQAP